MTALLLRYIDTTRYYTFYLYDNYLHTMGSLFKQLLVRIENNQGFKKLQI